MLVAISTVSTAAAAVRYNGVVVLQRELALLLLVVHLRSQRNCYCYYW
jgi:hypothetical protein